MPLNMVGPLAPLIGALISAVIAALVTYLVVVQRKKVAFWIATNESLVPPQNRHQNIVFKIGDKEMPRLNRGGIQVKNLGNSCIPRFAFELELLGEHPVCIAEVAARDAKLRDDVKLEQTASAANIVLKVSLDFFNPREAFQVLTYFDGIATDWNLSFRMEEVRFKVQRGDY
jgi:hypothetical protein